MDARLPLSEVMSANPTTITANASIREAAQRMRDARVGSLVVTHNGTKLAGIVTETDLVRKVIADGHAATDPVSSVMTADPVTIDSANDIVEALRLMSKHDFRRLPVMKDGHLVGMITEKDIARVAPSLLEIVADLKSFKGREPGDRGVEGTCEECGNEDENLKIVEGEALCSECLEQVLEPEQ